MNLRASRQDRSRSGIAMAAPWRVALAFALALALAFAACAPEPPPAPVAHSLILITVDTWRGDSFGAGGAPDIRTPMIDRFFRSSLQFAETYSPSPTTLASHTSLMTGAWPTRHGVPGNLWPVPEDVLTLAEILSEQGLATGAFVSSCALDVEFNLDQGFDKYNFKVTAVAKDDAPWRPAVRTLHRAQTWWQRIEGPRFLWTHLWEPHFPYEPLPVLAEVQDPGYEGTTDGSMGTLMPYWDPPPPSERDRRHVEALYHAEIAGLDRVLGRFLVGVDLEDTIVVLTGDHGESMGENDLFFKHGPHVSVSDTHVPLAIRIPGEAPRVSLAQVRTLDVPRTVLPLLGLDHSMLPEESTDILPLARGGKSLPVFAVATQPALQMDDDAFPGSSLQRILRLPGAAFVETPFKDDRAWFDRTTDPGERQRLPVPSSARADSMRDALDEWIGAGTFRPGYQPIQREDLREQLRSLGYLE